MKITQVSLCPSEAATKAGRPVLTPELLAASSSGVKTGRPALVAASLGQRDTWVIFIFLFV